MSKEITGETIGEVKPVLNMHQRKAEMARQADAFIALPGGYGTLEELLEVITWAQLGIHEKPDHTWNQIFLHFQATLRIVSWFSTNNTLHTRTHQFIYKDVWIVNAPNVQRIVHDVWHIFKGFVYLCSNLTEKKHINIDKAVDEGFITPIARRIIVSAETAHELMSKLEEYVPDHNGMATKLSWEKEQQLGHTIKSEIALVFVNKGENEAPFEFKIAEGDGIPADKHVMIIPQRMI
ncbi:hypothetical protein CTI12_AA441520 [Artemisia annua]|uniref:cytokinin riboside 5'-monophosphate phosphoribohydrolase n=1 Tax=Artemisia annua TaxID=35608 RepID=A0A2U1LYM6_ARTAN|nr:hypothetical protein CTI12_AA441520 [Artemisia annua]